MSALNPTSPAPWLSDAETPKGPSFARTLRAFAEEKRAEKSRPRSSPAIQIPQITQKRPVRPLGPLPRGPERMIERQTPGPGSEQAPVAKAAAAKRPLRAANVLAARKPPRPQNAPLLARAWGWLQKQNAFSANKQLHVCESVSLGEKRFVAVALHPCSAPRSP